MWWSWPAIFPFTVLLGLPRDWGVYAAIQDLAEQFPETKVILLDDRSVDANVREALRVRAAGYLTKQQPFPQIEASLRRAMRAHCTAACTPAPVLEG